MNGIIIIEAFDGLGTEVHANKVNHGWKVTTLEDWQNSDHEVLAALMLITTEVAEAAEAFRVDDIENFAEELADIIIRTAGLANGLGIDLGTAIVAKLQKNRMRPYKHGDKRV